MKNIILLLIIFIFSCQQKEPIKIKSKKDILLKEIKSLKREEIYKACERNSIKYNLEIELILAIIKTESNFDIYAQSKNLGCPGYSLGLMQINNYCYKLCDYYDIEENIDKGCGILTSNMKKGKIIKALVLYNAGAGKLKRNNIPAMTIEYCDKVLEYYDYLRSL